MFHKTSGVGFSYSFLIFAFLNKLTQRIPNKVSKRPFLFLRNLLQGIFQPLRFAVLSDIYYTFCQFVCILYTYLGIYLYLVL